MIMIIIIIIIFSTNHNFPLRDPIKSPRFGLGLETDSEFTTTVSPLISVFDESTMRQPVIEARMAYALGEVPVGG